MNTSASNRGTTLAVDVIVSNESLIVELGDGRTLSVPLHWFPRLVHGDKADREDWHFIGGGQGIHWELLDEDISVEGLISGNRSSESNSSFHRWLAKRNP